MVEQVEQSADDTVKGLLQAKQLKVTHTLY